MNTNWILIAHRSGARVFASTGPRSALTLVDDIGFEQGRLRPREIESDRPGRSHDRVGEQRHGVSAEQSPTEHLAVEFAQSLAAMLKAAHEAKKFDGLVLVAGPKFLGHLREALDKQTAAAVKATLDKDLGEIAAQDLPSHLQALL
ncbi:MAG: host attachment protein [Gammaproteobacteria bacterium]